MLLLLLFKLGIIYTTLNLINIIYNKLYYSKTRFNDINKDEAKSEANAEANADEDEANADEDEAKSEAEANAEANADEDDDINKDEAKDEDEDAESKDTVYNKTRFLKKRVPEGIDVLIIGSGISSLTLAGLLSKAGKKVLVIEQHYIAGGTTHSFEMDGIEHETGLHYVGNIEKRMKILNMITGKDRIEWAQLGGETQKKIYDKIIIDGKTYNFETGEENLKKYLIEEFPDEEKGIIRYFELVKRVSKKDLFFNLKSINYYYPVIEKYVDRFLTYFLKYIDPCYYKYCKKTAYDTIKEFIEDDELISVLCGQFGDYGSPPKKVNFFMHASIVNHYLDGEYFPKGGTNTISNKLIKSIEERGGKVLVSKGVKEIIIADNHAIGVIMDNDIEIYAKEIVSSVGIRNTFTKLVKRDIIDYANNLYKNNTETPFKLLKTIDRYKVLMENIPYSERHIYCFVKIKGNPKDLGLTSSNLWVYPHNNYEQLLEEFLEDPIENPIPLFIGFSCMKDPEWDSKYPGYSNCVILTVGKSEWFEEWGDTKPNKRGESYDNYKKQIGDRMMNELNRLYPQLEDKIESFNIATPLSTKYYMDINSYRFLNGWDLKPRTPIKNLYLTGQDICTLGFTGAMMSGVLTANVMMGYDNPIDIILGNNIIRDLS